MRILTSITVLGLSLISVSLAPLGAYAQSVAQSPDPQKLESLTKAEAQARAKDKSLAQKSQAVAKDITQLKKALQKSAKQTREFERETLRLQTRLEDVTARQNILQAKIQTDQGKMMELIAALQRLEITPPPAAASTPDDAIQAAQAHQLMRGLSEALHARADNVAFTLAQMEKIEAQIKADQDAHQANQTQLQKRREKVKRQVARKRKLQDSIKADRALSLAEVKRLAAESKNLRDLIESFESEVADIGPRVKPSKDGRSRSSGKKRSQPVKPVKLPKGTLSFAKAKGKMTRPITGPLLRNYGNGEKGLTYKGSSRGQVLAPYAGRVEFSGPFKNYEQVVILNVGGGYFVLLTGLGEVFSEAGDNVRLGEPVGVLPYSKATNPNLYIELRKDGKPLNPAPWFEPRPVKTG